MICFCQVLSERVKLKDYIGRICFYPHTHMICPTVTPVAVSSNVWKKLLGKVKQCNILKSLKMYACKIQKWKFVSVFNTAYHAGSRKACHKVCSNVIIDRFFALNCKKDQNNTETLSE